MATLGKTALLDADIIAYQVSASNEQRIDWDGDGNVSQYSRDLSFITDQADVYIGELKLKLNADEMVICLSDLTNWRHGVLPTYKQNRKGSLKPLQLMAVKEYLASNYNSYLKPSLEADDVMGILATHPTLIKGKKVIVSIDKDMKQIPGWLFNPDKDSKPQMVEASDGDYFHYFQTLTGDPVDGYSGCPKIGKVKATRILDEAKGEEWAAIVRTYEAAGLTEADALVQAQVARICQWQNYDYTTNEVIPWQPNKTQTNNPLT